MLLKDFPSALKHANEASQSNLQAWRCCGPIVWQPSRLSLLLPAPGLEVDVAAVVRVEGPEDVLAEGHGVAAGKEHGVHVHEGLQAEPAVGAVLYKAYFGRRICFFLYNL